MTFALPEESKDFTAAKNARVLQGGALPVLSATSGGKPFVICHTGVGAESCRARVAAFLDEHRPACLISSGFAGGLDPALKVGDVMLAENFSDASLLQNANLSEILRGAMTTQPLVAETAASKAALFTETRASAVDMETAIIAGLCKERGIPMISLRGISDSAKDDLPVSFSIWFNAAAQKPRVGALLWHLATHPGKIPAFARFVKGINLSRARLTEQLLNICSELR